MMRRIAVLVVLSLTSAVGVAAAQPDDWEVKRNPFDKRVIGRYKSILARNPHDGTALNKLVDMYRRYKTVELLQSEYQKQLEKSPNDFSTLVVLGRIDRSGGNDAGALARFEAAAKVKANDTALWLELGTLYRNSGKVAEARKAFDNAVPGAKATKMKALRALADLALSGNDIEGARRYFEAYIAIEPKNVQLRLELGDALLAAGKHPEAIKVYKDAEGQLGGDPARRVEVIARIGQALEQSGNDNGAAVEYRRAIKLVPRGYFIERELTMRIVEIYRRKQELGILLAQYENEWAVGRRGFFEWDTLARLYEETGQQDKAIAAYRKAVAKSPWELETQRRLIQILENTGQDAEAMKQFEEVVRVAPGEARFQIDLAERHWKRGDLKKALDSLKRLEGRFPGDAGILAAVADLYMRWGKDDLALAALEKLTRLEPDDPGHLVTLGEQYFTRGDRDKALATWKRIAASKTATGYARLGEVLAEHNFPIDAEGNFNKAIKMEPNNPDHYRGRAQLYESTKKLTEAIADWEKALSLTAAKERVKRRDLQRRLVQVIARAGGSKELEFKGRWERDFGKKPPDVEAGFFLVEYYNRKPIADGSQPRLTLIKLHEQLPDDQEVIVDLVKAYRIARQFDKAVALLERLAKLSPPREREAFTQISEIMTEARRDKEAIDWAKRALKSRPNDPIGYKALAERYVEMQRYDDAIEQYEQSLKLDAKNWKVRFAVANLYSTSSRYPKAAEQYRYVLRNATDDELIGDAARLAIDLAESRETFDELEPVLVGLAFEYTNKAIYRRKLVDLYLRWVPMLVSREAHGPIDVRKSMRDRLVRVGGHGLKPLLEALHDERDPQQQRVAVEVLGHLGNKGAAAPLVQLAKQEPKADPNATGRGRIGTLTQTAELELRVDALVAAGRLGDPKVIDKVLELDHDDVSMREATTFTLGRTRDKRALAPLIAALGHRRDSVQALACIGLGEIDDARAIAAMTQIVAEPRQPDAVRAACAYGLGVRRARSSAPALVGALGDNHGETQRLAAWALGHIGDAASTGPLIRAYFARRSGERHELAWAIAKVTGSPGAIAMTSPGDYPQRTDTNGRRKFDLAARIANLPGIIPPITLPPQMLSAHTDQVIAGIVDGLAEHRDIVLGVLADLDARPDGLGLAGLIGDGKIDDKTRAALNKIGAGVTGPIVKQLAADDPKIRALALSVLGKIDAKGIDDAIAKGLADGKNIVRQAAMRAVVAVAARRGSAPKALVAGLAAALGSKDWQDRLTAATAMGGLGAGADVAALARARSDSRSFVREAIATALGASGSAAAVEPVIALSRDDIAPVRAASAQALAKLPGDAARKRRAELATDPDPTVAKAAGAK
jgi:tetratricopeptide (TPR) repeat protein/HEAT repeat protein